MNRKAPSSAPDRPDPVVRPVPRDQRGFTLLELMIVVALIAIITPALTYLFSKASQGMAADEMHIQLQSLNENTMLRLHERVSSARHMMLADTSGVSYLQAVTTGMSANTKSLYPILAGTSLPLGQPLTGTGSFSPTLAVKADFGNSLLFGAYDIPQTFGSKFYYSPATVAYSASSAYVTYSTGQPATQIIDLYRFVYYYLTSINPKSLRSVASYRLIEWQSLQYADYNEIGSIGDPTLQSAAISWLATPGNVNPGSAYGVTWAWDPTGSDPGQSFYTLSATTGLPTFKPWPVNIVEGNVTSLTRVSSGILSNGFFYGISPNSSGWSDAPATVPAYGVAAGSFPGGFEVGVAGSSTGREVMIRSLLVAQGAAPRVIWNDQSMVTNIRDVW